MWEFNATFPIRNVVFPYVVLSPSLYLLRWINSTGISAFQLTAVKVVMATRLPLSFLSLFGYVATGRLADSFHINRYLSTVLYCSSYVSWAYFTRTFSNSVEAVLLAAVLLLALTFSGRASVAKQSSETVAALDTEKNRSDLGSSDVGCTTESSADKDHLGDDVKSDTQEENSSSIPASEERECTRRSPFLKNELAVDKENTKETDKTEGKLKEESKETEEERSKEELKDDIKKYMQVKEVTLRDNDRYEELTVLRMNIAKLVSFLLGAIVTAGFFNRPTFLIFATVPVIYWMWNVTRCDCQGKLRGVPLFIVVLNLSLGAVFAFVTFVLLDTLYFNPDFIKIVSYSLSACMDDPFSWQTLQTGLQTVASSLVITPWNFIKYNFDVRNLAEHGLHPRYTHFLINLPLLLGPLYVPLVIVCILSLFRLLRGSESTNSRSSLAWLMFMGLVPVLGLSVFPHQEPRFLIPALPVYVVLGAKIVSAMLPGKLSFFALWTVFNIVLTLVYGYVHQAALIPALSIYQQKLSSSLSRTSNVYHAIFYKTYPPPRHLLLLRPENSRVSIHELAGAPVDTLLQRVRHVQDECRKSRVTCQVHVFLPSTVTSQVEKHLSDSKIKATSICPHLSMEAPPRLRAWWKKRLSFQDFIMDFCLNILRIS